MNLSKQFFTLSLSLGLLSCATTPPKPVSEMTFEEYQKSIGRRQEPDDWRKPKYATNEEFKDYEAWVAAGGHKQSAPKNFSQSKSTGPSMSEALAVASAGLQLANTLNNRNQSTVYRQNAAPNRGSAQAEGGWYPYVHELGPGKGYFVINGKKYWDIELKFGNGSLARPIGPPIQ